MNDVATTILRSLTMEQKFNAMVALHRTARELKAAGFRREHPEWSEERVKKEVRDAFLYARD